MTDLQDVEKRDLLGIEYKGHLYTRRQVFAGTIFGGPIAGIYMLYKNAKNLGEDSHASKIFYYGLFYCLTIITIIYILNESPAGDSFSRIVSLLSAVIATTSFQQIQASSVASCLLNNTAKKAGFRRVVLVTIVSALLLLFFAVLYLYFLSLLFV